MTPYTQLNCVAHTNGTANIQTHNCLVNGTTYEAVCGDEDKTCINTQTRFVSCGNSLFMAAIDALNSDATCTSSAMSLAASAFFAMIAALALLF